MSKSSPTVMKYMTYQPHTINEDQTLEKAKDMMREYNIRHLPVLRAGELVGILSDRDINLVLTFASLDMAKMKVSEACRERPYTTTPSAKLSEVATVMAEHKYGSAIVMDNKKVVGIFTEIDALKVLAQTLS